MKLVAKNVDKGGAGWVLDLFFRHFIWFSIIYFCVFFFDYSSVVLVPEEPEDMWHAYNLISNGDNVRSTTVRKVQNETSTGSSSSSRIRTTLTIKVESIDFDTQACVLRLKGRNIEENQYVKVRINIYKIIQHRLWSRFEEQKKN